MTREASHVHLVNDCPRAWPLERNIAFPVVCMRIYYDALHGNAGVVVSCENSVPAVAPRDDYASSVWIEEQFAGIKSHPVRRIPGSVHAISVNLARTPARHEDVPVVVRPVRRGVKRNHARRTC